jgi:hypothetical protein
MRSVLSRVLKCGLWATLAWACFACSLSQPRAAGADKNDLTEEDQGAVELALRRLPDLRNLDDREIKKKVAEATAKHGQLFNLGPILDNIRSVPRIGYCIYAGLFMDGDHYYQGKLIRADFQEFLTFSTPHLKAALTRKYGKPEPGSKFEWMKVKPHVKVVERCHWNFKATIVQDGKPIEIMIACELTFREDKQVIISLIDIERAELIGKALGRK